MPREPEPGSAADRADESGDAVVLSSDEMEALAIWLAAGRVADVEGWLEWEDLPMLSEAGMRRLDGFVKQLSDRLRREAASFGVDPQEVLERVR